MRFIQKIIQSTACGAIKVIVKYGHLVCIVQNGITNNLVALSCGILDDTKRRISMK